MKFCINICAPLLKQGFQNLVKRLLGGDFFIGWWEHWFWPFEPSSELKTTSCKYWISLKIKISIPLRVQRVYISLPVCISLLVYPSRFNLKLHNISVTSKTVKKPIMNLDLSKVSGPAYIPMMVLMHCEPELSYLLAELFNKCLKESCFPDCWKAFSISFLIDLAVYSFYIFRFVVSP